MMKLLVISAFVFALVVTRTYSFSTTQLEDGELFNPLNA